jgi:transcriptional regulator with XRE-family HTH domain
MSNNGVPLNTEILRAARLRKGLSYRAVAELCKEHGAEITQVTYSRWERGSNWPYPRNLPALAAALELTVDEMTRVAA